ncbi:MAG: DUF4340 domain-containing protein [Alphaproteobacteria bacterium]|nr:DUF4340 domain-containing protein [Alphaproteobacteria bacterium]|tara:strand:+ start:1745 stop:2752 length:1008 start_codon:yes stop_codon:yes gene_type:complete
MSNRNFTYLILTTVTLFALAFISYLIQPRYETFIKKGELIFKETQKQLNNIKEINIDNSKKKITILKNEDNNWYMSSKSSYKAKNETVRKNLIQITELRFFEKKTEQESLYSRLDLDYPKNDDGDSKLITIFDDSSEKIIEFVLGKKKKNGVYIKKINDKTTWLTSGGLEMSSVEQDWLETKILDINYENVKKITINHSNKNESFSLTKDDKNENLLIDGLTKEQLPKSDLIANFLGYFFTNLIFEDVFERKNIIDKEVITKINFELFNGSNIYSTIFKKDKNKWINISIDDQSALKLEKNKDIFVDNIKNWTYKLSSTKYNVADTKLKDLLVED